MNERQRRLTRRRKALVIWAYGGVCACCREHRLSLLTIDHIAGDGGEHRRHQWGFGTDQSRYSGQVFYRWLIRHQFPDGFQVLCWPCNTMKGKGTTCPCREYGGVLDEFPDMITLLERESNVTELGRERALGRASDFDPEALEIYCSRYLADEPAKSVGGPLDAPMASAAETAQADAAG